MTSAVGDPYSPQTRRYFENPAHAGDLAGDYTTSAVAQASESDGGACVQLAIGLRDGKLAECRFRIFGCPHLIAAAEWLCSESEGRTFSALSRFQAGECMKILGIPVDKTGRVLLLEDTIRLLTDKLARAAAH